MIALPAITFTLGDSAQAPAPADLREAARRFEAIFVRQMLSQARKASFGNDLFGGQAMQTFRQMQDEQVAELAAARGVFGIAAMLEARLAAPPAPGGED